MHTDLRHVLVFAPLDGEQQLGQRLGEVLSAVVAQRPDQILLVLAQLGERVALHDLLQLDVELLPAATLRETTRKEEEEEGDEGGRDEQ